MYRDGGIKKYTQARVSGRDIVTDNNVVQATEFIIKRKHVAIGWYAS